MQLKIVGKPDQVKLAVCRKAIRYFGKKLLSKHLYKSIKLKVVFTTEGLCKAKGTCGWNDSPRYGRDFTIHVHSGMGVKPTLLCLAHEMVHVKQWAKGELIDYHTNFNKSMWRGKVIYHNENKYWECPWEIDAYGREIGLYKTFMEIL